VENSIDRGSGLIRPTRHPASAAERKTRQIERDQIVRT
jgi:hypothetical protein